MKNTTTKTNAAKNAALARAMEEARKHLDLETLDTRNRDALDFHSISVDAIREVVRMAFEAGKNAR